MLGLQGKRLLVVGAQTVPTAIVIAGVAAEDVDPVETRVESQGTVVFEQGGGQVPLLVQQGAAAGMEHSTVRGQRQGELAIRFAPATSPRSPRIAARLL